MASYPSSKYGGGSGGGNDMEAVENLLEAYSSDGGNTIPVKTLHSIIRSCSPNNRNLFPKNPLIANEDDVTAELSFKSGGSGGGGGGSKHRKGGKSKAAAGCYSVPPSDGVGGGGATNSNSSCHLMSAPSSPRDGDNGQLLTARGVNDADTGNNSKTRGGEEDIIDDDINVVLDRSALRTILLAKREARRDSNTQWAATTANSHHRRGAGGGEHFNDEDAEIYLPGANDEDNRRDKFGPKLPKHCRIEEDADGEGAAEFERLKRQLRGVGGVGAGRDDNIHLNNNPSSYSYSSSSTKNKNGSHQKASAVMVGGGGVAKTIRFGAHPLSHHEDGSGHRGNESSVLLNRSGGRSGSASFMGNSSVNTNSNSYLDDDDEEEEDEEETEDECDDNNARLSQQQRRGTDVNDSSTISGGTRGGGGIYRTKQRRGGGHTNNHNSSHHRPVIMNSALAAAFAESERKLEGLHAALDAVKIPPRDKRRRRDKTLSPSARTRKLSLEGKQKRGGGGEDDTAEDEEDDGYDYIVDEVTGQMTRVAKPKKKKKTAVNAAILTQLFSKLSSPKNRTVDDVLEAIDRDDNFAHGWQDQRRKPGTTVMFVGHNKLARKAQHGFMLPEIASSDQQQQGHRHPHNTASYKPSSSASTALPSVSQSSQRQQQQQNDQPTKKKIAKFGDDKSNVHVTPIAHRLPEWKQAWLMLSNKSTNPSNLSATQIKYKNLAESKKYRHVQGSGLHGLTQEKPYTLTATERSECYDRAASSLETRQEVARERRLLAQQQAVARGGGGVGLSGVAYKALSALTSWRDTEAQLSQQYQQQQQQQQNAYYHHHHHHNNASPGDPNNTMMMMHMSNGNRSASVPPQYDATAYARVRYASQQRQFGGGSPSFSPPRQPYESEI